MGRGKILFTNDRVMWLNYLDSGEDMSGVVTQTMSWSTKEPLKKGYLRIQTDEAVDNHSTWDVPEELLMSEEDYWGQSLVTLKCTFEPKKWMGSETIPVDVIGDASWEMEYKGRVPRPGSYEARELRHAEGAPSWVKDWRGPFTVAFEVIASEQVSIRGERR